MGIIWQEVWYKVETPIPDDLVPGISKRTRPFPGSPYHPETPKGRSYGQDDSVKMGRDIQRTRGTAGGRATGMAYLVAALAEGANQDSVEKRISAELELIGKDVEARLLKDVQGNGVLAVVHIITFARPSGLEQWFISAHAATFASDPQAAIRRYLTTERIETAAPKTGSDVKRYFWGIV